MTKERNREYNYSVTCLRADGSHGCGLLSGAPTLAASVTKAFRDVAYYLREAKNYGDDGYPAVILEMREVCGECRATGFIYRTPRRSKKCPACKGAGEFGILFVTKIERLPSLAVVERAS